MSMYNDIVLGEGNTEKCERNSPTVAEDVRKFSAVIGHSWGLDQKRNGSEPTTTNPTDPGTKLQRT